MSRRKWGDDPEAERLERERERARDLLRSRSNTKGVLKSEREWYLERAADPSETPENRALWQQLADELAPRLPSERSQEDGLW